MILLTGASGFIGSHLLDKLVNIFGSDQIVALTSKPISKCPFILHNNYSFDNKTFIKAGFKNIDTIIHSGAFIPKTSNEGNDIERCNSNIQNTCLLLKAELPGIKNFIYLSTIDVYEYDNPITEESKVNPFSLYGNSKFYCEKLVSVWASQNDKTHQILRIGHVFGPGEEKYQKIIPVTMKRILNGDAIQLYGDGNDIRSFIFIDDVIEAIVNAITLKIFSGVINIVGNEQISINELVHKIITIANRPTDIENINSVSKNRDLVFDNKKMKELLCKPKTNLSEGLIREWEYLQKSLL